MSIFTLRFMIYTSNMMKYVIICCLITGMFRIVNCQTITIRDLQTGEPIEMASLKSEETGTFVSTNVSGNADITAFAGSEKIEIRRLGYKTEYLRYSDIVKMKYVVFMISTVHRIDEIVVSATRWGQSSRNVPSKIRIITPTEAALHNPQTAADLLGASGEVFIQKSQQGGGSPMIRGFSTNRLLYSVDGVRMNSAIFRSGNIQNVISLDPLAIENTEVFFGPGSVMYGSDAIGGVMSFRTINPRLSANDKPLIKASALARYSSANNEMTGHFDINTGWKKWAFVTSVTHTRFGDLRMGKNGPDDYLRRFFVVRIDDIDKVVENPDPLVQNPSGYSQINLMQKLRFRPNENWNFEYAFHYSETSAFSRYDRLIELTPNGLPRSAVWNYGPQKWMMNHLSVHQTGNNRFYDNMVLRLAQQYFEESRIDRNFSGGQRFRLRTNLEEVIAYSVNLDFEKRNHKHRFYYGMEYVINDVTSKGSATDIRNNNPIAVPDRYPASRWSSYAAYLNCQYDASEKWMIQAGARHSSFDIKSDFTRHLSFFPFEFTDSRIKNASLTGSVGLVYSPDKSWKISANAGTGFRAPNIDDIGKIFDFVGGEIVVPNTALKAEYAYNAEFGINKLLGDIVKLDITGFYTYLDNAMVRRAFLVNGQDSVLYNGQLSRVYAIQNAAFAKVYGFNAGIEIALPSGINISSSYNYQFGEEEMDNGEISRSRHAAPAFGVSRLSYQTDMLMMQLYIVYSTAVPFAALNQEERQKPAIYAKDRDSNPYSPGWYTINFKSVYQFHPNLSFSAGIENITDQRYRPYSSGLVSPGRNVVLSLKATI
jgi:hemoglobin/transferrin/lactoferrin receptor protein